MENAREVVVIGGGIAGLTCAWKLLERGAGRLRVTVLEGESEAGGQARAFKVGAHTVEHGSHAFFGYYDTILNLIAELRADAALGAEMPGLVQLPGWTLVDAEGRRALLTHTRYLPRWLSVVPSILRLPWFSWRDKIGALRGALSLIRTRLKHYDELDRSTSLEYARRVGYTERGALTWNSASLGLTNLFVQEQSAAIFAGKHRLLMGSERGLSYQLPAGDLTALFARPAARRIQSLGGSVETGARALAVERVPQGRTRVRFMRGGDTVEREADHVILALQPWHARELVPWVNAPWTTLQRVTPVITMMLGLSGRIDSSGDARELGCSREHWSFSVITDLSRFWPEYAGASTVLRVEIGHADLLPRGVDTPEAELVSLVKRDLDRLYPDAALLQVVWSAAHRETNHLYVRWIRGEFAKRPTLEQRALGNGIVLAGDWTSKGTIGMEAAANSGYEAANLVLTAERLAPLNFRDVPVI